MAGQIYGFNQVFNASGSPLNGAKLLTRVPGTTTPKATYTDSTLTVQLPNPIIADSAGRFPQIFADEGEVYDLVLTTSADVTVESYYDVIALGASSGDIDIDFGLDGRFRVVGFGGEPSIEFGDPTGDDVGGDGRIGGWNNTQGNNLELDFATVTFTGSPVVGGFDEPYPRKLAGATFAAVSSFDLPLSDDFSNWELRLSNLIQSSTGNYQLQFSFDGGATYKSGATDYTSQSVYGKQNGATGLYLTSTTGAFMRIMAEATGSVTPRKGLFSVLIASGVGEETQIISKWTEFSASANNPSMGQVGAQTNNTSYGKATNLRLSVSTGTMSGRYSLIGLP